MNDLRISLIIPAYNEERYLAACLDSVATQIVKPYEVIVADNNSTDKTAEVAARYPFVKVIRAERQGVVFARDAGFGAARGDIIGRIDADTVLPPDWIETVRDYYSDEHKLARYALTGGTMPYNIRLPRFSSWLQGQLAFRLNRLLLGHYILFGSNMALPAKLWRKVEHDICARTDIHEDLDLSIHLHRHGFETEYWAGWLVGTKLRRIRSNRNELWGNLQMWPRTLHVHGNSRWIFGWIGAASLFALSFVPLAAEYLARFMGKHDMPE